MTTAKKRGGLTSLIRIAYRNIFRNTRRSIFCIIAISITVFFIIVMAALMDGMIDNFKKQIFAYETGDLLVTSKDYDKKSLFLPLNYPLSIEGKSLDETVSELEAIEGVEKANPRIKTRVSFLDSTVKNGILWGIDMEKELPYAVFNYKTKNKDQCLAQGRYPSGSSNECAIGFRLAEKLKVGIGDKVRFKLISSEFSAKYYSPVIVGITDFNFLEMDRNAIIIPFAKAQRLAQLPGSTQGLFVFLDKKGDADSAKSKIEARYGNLPNVSVKPFEKHAYIVLLAISDIMMAIIYIVFLVVASFLIINTIIMVIHERIKEIGMMGALGMTRREITSVFFFESLVLSGAGALLGCVLGGALTFVLSVFPFDVGSLYGNMMPMNDTIFVTFSPFIIVQGFLYGLVVSGICTIFPSLKSAFIKPVEAIRR
jgi:putative ABC transport system permease protein